MKATIFGTDASELDVKPHQSVGRQQRVAAFPLSRHTKAFRCDNRCVFAAVSRYGMESLVHETDAQMAMFAQASRVDMDSPLSFYHVNRTGYSL